VTSEPGQPPTFASVEEVERAGQVFIASGIRYQMLWSAETN
jgi:hypothetical protein